MNNQLLSALGRIVRDVLRTGVREARRERRAASPGASPGGRTPRIPGDSPPGDAPGTATRYPGDFRGMPAVEYSPVRGNRPDHGEVVWTWVPYEEDHSQGKDRPVLVVGRDRATLLGLMLSSQARHADDTNWVGIGAGSWDEEHRASWVRLDRVLDVPEAGIRREGAIVERTIFEVVAARLRADYSWS